MERRKREMKGEVEGNGREGKGEQKGRQWEMEGHMKGGGREEWRTGGEWKGKELKGRCGLQRKEKKEMGKRKDKRERKIEET